MASGKLTCPVCAGAGKIKEDTNEYEFLTRDPQTSRCLVCSGKGWVGTRTKLPNGKPVTELIEPHLRNAKKVAKGKDLIPDLGLDRSVPEELKQGALNVSRKKRATTEDTEGAEKSIMCEVKDPVILELLATTEDTEGSEKPVRYELPRFVEMATNPRLNKVLASGKDFLIITDTEPYYLDVFRMIRAQEKIQESWTLEDDERYIEALEREIELMTTREANNG
ncbi:MAG: hypothetical protein LHW64_06790 [Candidatus Cloacimonetes bacterium]|jgi:hypothetical protein|nr:hypothetical protein [Candidatus Cloacimonadota bacterium]MCB5287492.1 hypothetical protein [Candidatus Cloacimonadota bacterium]MCK9185257.1 hypothetical protein [Candidatus Cloacimonadota bacterium]MDY0229813.1 hypothetical protein [Candidatus Cloacimonadaceae bacterium]